MAGCINCIIHRPALVRFQNEGNKRKVTNQYSHSYPWIFNPIIFLHESIQMILEPSMVKLFLSRGFNEEPFREVTFN